jgi:hypothetical protein
LLDAWVDIVCKGAKKWFKTKNIKYSQNFTESKNETEASNDLMGDFLDKYVEITGNKHEIIAKQKMYDKYKIMYPKSYITMAQLISSVKEKKIKYESDKRCNSVKGSFKRKDSCNVAINPYEEIQKLNDELQFYKMNPRPKNKNWNNCIK